VKLLVAALVVAGVVALAPEARAQSCSFMSVTAPAFGTYDVFSAASNDTAGSLSYSCTGGATVTITLSRGSAPSFSPRQMQRSGGGTPMSYNLYLDAGHAQIWGDGTSSTFVSGPTSPADNAVNVVPIFGSIPAGQDVAVGGYGDTVVVTLNF
jgi:spore coat protein U-like protein